MDQHEPASQTPLRYPIAALSPALVERIAAGEVIERPASVVRELIENALDAGATRIRVELREGGIRMVRVADDGHGIASDELELAVTTHATSKLRFADDLNHVRTLGFRGEALASIATIAHLTITSAVESDVGTRLTINDNGSRERGFEPRPTGTTVSARDLFHSTPPRRAALGSARREERLALATVRGYALTHATVGFIVITDGSVAMHAPGTGSEAAVAAIYGADVARDLLAFGPLEVDGGKLHGWIAPRAFTMADRSHILVCVNGRPVRNRILLTALEAGYRPLLRKGRHPILLAHLDLDPALVDVNIHPAKAEVLLRSERTVASVLRDVTHTTLGQAPIPAPDPSARATYSIPFSRQYLLPLGRRRRVTRIAEPRPRFSPAGGATSDTQETHDIPPLQPLGQLAHSLIVATSAEGQLYLVDQHRAHERLLYEALRQEAGEMHYSAALGVSEGGAYTGVAAQPGQMLLEPLVIALTPRQAEVLAGRLEELAALGLSCEPFGGTTFLVRSLPALPGAALGPAAYAGELAADAAEDAPDWRDYFCTSLACRAAVRRGQPLTVAEQRKLLNDLRGAAVTSTCPHGSPIILSYNQRFLARAFEW